ncbi:MAG: SGNH/GDSL hydrolase family protein [Chloroflexi bacterium]|nr:SGNH/GDSL hydrolase family protein [Chloroflexota bacterium]
MKTTFERIETALRKALQKRGSIYFSYTDVAFKYPWLCFYNTGLVLKAKLFNGAIIHIIGDSHVRPFVFKSPFLVHHISQATAYNLTKDNSFSQSKKYLSSFLPRINRERDVLLLIFGEIDARVHIYLQYRKNDGKISIEKIIDATVEKYGETIRRLRDDGFAVCVHGIPPAARKNFVSNLPFLGTPEQRSEISSMFSKKLGEFCQQNGIPYIDVQSVSAGENGFIKKEYVADEVHLNGKIVPFARERIVEAFKDCRKFN